jgi:hypothetical protein
LYGNYEYNDSPPCEESETYKTTNFGFDSTQKKLMDKSNVKPSYGCRGFAMLTTRHPLCPQKVGINFADKWQSLGRYSSLTD